MEITKEQTNPRVHLFIDRAYHLIYRDLISTRADGDIPPFKDMKDVFMLAAFIGYKEEKWIPLIENRKDTIPWSSITEDSSMFNSLRALALVKTEDIEVLTNERKIQDIAEGYANGGFTVIHKQVAKEYGERLTHLTRFLGKLLLDVQSESTSDKNDSL